MNICFEESAAAAATAPAPRAAPEAAAPISFGAAGGARAPPPLRSEGNPVLRRYELHEKLGSGKSCCV